MTDVILRRRRRGIRLGSGFGFSTGNGLALGAGGGGAPIIAAPANGLIFHGDSIVEAPGAVPASTEISTLFQAITGLTAYNRGHSGYTLQNLIDNFAADVTAVAGAGRGLYSQGGVNDILNGGLTGAQTWAKRQALSAVERAAGYTVANGKPVVVPTIGPTAIASPNWTAQMEIERGIYNNLLRANWRTVADTYVDIDRNPRLANPNDAGYYADKLHPTAQGRFAYANDARLILGLPTLADVTPSAYSFTDVTGATVSTLYTSNTIQVQGFTDAVPFSITGGEYSQNGGAWSTAPGIAYPWDTFAVRATSSGSTSTAVNVVLTIGGVSDTYTVTTAASAAAFNTSPLVGSWTYSNGNRSVVATAAVGAVIADRAIVGKKVFAVTVDAAAAQQWALVGVADGTDTVNNLLNSTKSVALVGGLGQMWSGGSGLTTGPSFTTNGTTVGLAVDASGKLAWWTIDGTNWFGGGFAGAIATSAVIAGTGGQSISNVAAAIYPVVGSSDNTGHAYTLLTAWPWTIPTGFSYL